jgi:hypothetical protein
MRLSCRSFAANAVRLQVHALAYNLGKFLRALATPESIKHSLTTLREKLIKIGAKFVRHAAMSPSINSPSREICSPTSCGCSRSFGRRLILRRREEFGCRVFQNHGRGAS